jgi:hypothetical protein
MSTDLRRCAPSLETMLESGQKLEPITVSFRQGASPVMPIDPRYFEPNAL